METKAIETQMDIHYHYINWKAVTCQWSPKVVLVGPLTGEPIFHSFIVPLLLYILLVHGEMGWTLSDLFGPEVLFSLKRNVGF